MNMPGIPCRISFVYTRQSLKKLFYAADPDRLSDIGVYDVESFRIAKGMASHPTWTEVLRPTCQYGLSKAGNLDKDGFGADIDSHVINSIEHINLAQTGEIKEHKHSASGPPVFQ